MNWINKHDFIESLGFVNEEGDFLELKVHKSIFFMLRVTSEVITQNDMPIETEILIQKLLQTLSYLSETKFTFRPSLSRANLLSLYNLLISLMTASRILSGQSRGQSTSAPKMVLKTCLLFSDCSVAIFCNLLII